MDIRIHPRIARLASYVMGILSIPGFLIFYIPVASAAPELTVEPPFLVWNGQSSPVRFTLALRKDARRLVIRVRDSEGQVLHREELFNWTPGLHEWKWSGKLQSGEILATGIYNIEFRIFFTDDSSEDESTQLRVIPVPEAAVRAPGGYTPPTIKPYEPSYRISGNLSTFRRFDGENDTNTTETRLNSRYTDHGEHFKVDANLGYFRRSPRFENFDSSNALIRGNWDGGVATAVFRRSLGDFRDPLRLYADFRTQNDKFGFRWNQHIRTGELSALAFKGKGTTQREAGGAARWQHALSPDIDYGLGFTSHRVRDPLTGETTTYAGSLDSGWNFTKSNRIVAEGVYTQTTGISAGNGFGTRMAWVYKGLPGLRTSLGYLNLSSNYGASLSDPGNQITANVRGPEATLNFFSPAMGPWIRDLALTANAFTYRRRNNKPRINQIDWRTQFSVKKAVRVSGSYRRRREAGNLSTTMRFAEQHAWSDAWRGGVQYSMNTLTGSRTHRILIDASTGLADAYHRIALELIRRSGTSVLFGLVKEAGLLASGRWRHLVYETVLRFTDRLDQNGLNSFVRLAYEEKYLHRYLGNIYFAFGDRSALGTARRYEIGAALSY